MKIKTQEVVDKTEAKISINEGAANEIKSDYKKDDSKEGDVSNLNQPLLCRQGISSDLERIFKKEARPYHWDKVRNN